MHDFFFFLVMKAGGGQLPFSQAGPSASGPGPAHVQHNAPMGQYNVVVMPQPPPHTVNQATLSNHHHGHQYQQHHVPGEFFMHLHTHTHLAYYLFQETFNLRKSFAFFLFVTHL